MSDEAGYDYRSFPLLNFSGAAIMDFITSKWLPKEASASCLRDVIILKWRPEGILKWGLLLEWIRTGS